MIPAPAMAASRMRITMAVAGRTGLLIVSTCQTFSGSETGPGRPKKMSGPSKSRAPTACERTPVTVGRAGRLSVHTWDERALGMRETEYPLVHASQLSATDSGCLSGLHLRFLTRPGCRLCDQARPLVERVAKRAKATLEEVDVDTVERLHTEYGSRIPVVLGPGGEVIAEGVIGDRRKLRGEIRRLSRSSG